MLGLGLSICRTSRVGGGGAAPGVPTGLSATPGDTTVELTWDAVDGATGYNIYRDGVRIRTNYGDNVFDDSGLTNGTTYSYAVSAVNGAGESAQSPPVTAAPITKWDQTDPDTLACLHFDEGSGTPVDASGNVTVSTVGSPTWAGSGLAGGGDSMALSGSGQYVYLGTLLDTVPANGSIGLWWKPGETYTVGNSGPRIFSKFNAEPGGIYDGWDWYLDPDTGKLTVLLICHSAFADAKVLTSTRTTWTAGATYKIRVTWGAAGYCLFIDGHLDAYSPWKGKPSNGPFYQAAIGAYSVASPSNFIHGTVDEFVALSRQLTVEEVHQADALQPLVPQAEEAGKIAAATRSVVFAPSGSGWNKDMCLEPTNPVKVGGTTFMWFTGINKTTGKITIGLATSADDGDTWSEYGSNPVIGNTAGGFSGSANGACAVPYNGGTFLLFFVGGYASGTNMYRVHLDTDGHTVLAGPTVCMSATQESWFIGTSNPSVYIDTDAGIWRMVFSPFVTGGGPLGGRWVGAYAESNDDGVTWTNVVRLSSMSLAGDSTDSFNPRWLHFDGSLWHAYGQVSFDVSLPGIGAHWTSADAPDANNWTLAGHGDPIFFPAGETLPSGLEPDQVSDQTLHLRTSSTVIYYDVDRNVSEQGQEASVWKAVYAGTFANLIA